MSRVKASAVGDVRLFFKGSSPWNTKEGRGAYVSGGQLTHIESGETVPDGELNVFQSVDGRPLLEAFVIAWPLITQTYPRTGRVWDMSKSGVSAQTEKVIFSRA